MNKFLAVYGKPRYLGIVEYEGDIIKGTSIIVESHRGEEIAVTAVKMDQRPGFCNK